MPIGEKLSATHVGGTYFRHARILGMLLLVGSCLDVPMQGMRFGISALCTNRVYELLR